MKFCVIGYYVCSDSDFLLDICVTFISIAAIFSFPFTLRISSLICTLCLLVSYTVAVTADSECRGCGSSGGLHRGDEGECATAGGYDVGLRGRPL